MEVCSVDRLNLLQLAPGGHLGRFCVWTKSAVEKLDAIFGGSGLAHRCPAPHKLTSWAAMQHCFWPGCAAGLHTAGGLPSRGCKASAWCRPGPPWLTPPPPFPPSLPGTTETESAQKKGYKLPRHIMANGDLARLINSDEVQVCAPPGSSAPGF